MKRSKGLLYQANFAKLGSSNHRGLFVLRNHHARKFLLAIDLSSINKHKAVFDDIYAMSDPRTYFSVLGALDYMIPDVAEAAIRQILAARAEAYGDDINVLDIGCSYGINAALQRLPVNFASLRQRYARREIMAVDPEEMIRLDRMFYASWPEMSSVRFTGLDRSRDAIRYADAVGLHATGVAADLEKDRLSQRDKEIVAACNVFLSTGAIGYVTDRTYRHLLDAAARPPWVISFVLRMFPFDAFIETFKGFGMVTEKLANATFVQRRFRDEEEFKGCLQTLANRGISTRGLEEEGLLHAELFLSRPKSDARAKPLNEIVTISSGRFNTLGARYVKVEQDGDLKIGMEA